MNNNCTALKPEKNYFVLFFNDALQTVITVLFERSLGFLQIVMVTYTHCFWSRYTVLKLGESIWFLKQISSLVQN